MYNSTMFISELSSVTVDFSCKKWIRRVLQHIIDILSDSDHSNKVAPTTLTLEGPIAVNWPFSIFTLSLVEK